MYEFHPYYTNDGSVGLYSSDFDDIYHSASGALTEAYEKFVYPIDFERLLKKESIKVLDICYGIGYNTKSFLNYIFFENQSRKNFSKNLLHADNNIDSIYTNNIFAKIASFLPCIRNNSHSCNVPIYTNNISNAKIPKIYIKAVDSDKNLSLLSPFILTGQKYFRNNKFNFHYDKINKFLTKEKATHSPKINKIINFLILDKILQNNSEIYENNEVIPIIESKEFNKYFDHKMKGILEHYLQSNSQCSTFINKQAFLHNIYYRNIAKSYKNYLKVYNLQDIDFELKNDDARKIIKEDKNTYNLIFLDAFSPSKCPCLWSYDFFKVLYEHLEPDGVILTYSKSASIRSAMIEANLAVGYIYDEKENIVTGTIASRDRSVIKYPLSEYDLGLIKTKAGIFYRDENLTALNEAILKGRDEEQKNSSKISRSCYEKQYKEDKCPTMS